MSKCKCKSKSSKGDGESEGESEHRHNIEELVVITSYILECVLCRIQPALEARGRWVLQLARRDLTCVSLFHLSHDILV